MSGIENTIIARYEKDGEHFEILVNPKTAYDYKMGVKKDFSNILAFDEVFKDAKKGERQSSSTLKKAFGTDDVTTVAKKIFEEGELQLTTEQKRKAVAEKKMKIVALIAANVVDPRAKTPHPPSRIEKALEEARFHVDAFKRAEEQMEDAIESIREILPISVEKMRLAVRIPAQYAHKSYGMLKGFCIKQEEWANDGSLIVVIEFPAGIQGEFYDRLNKLTGGQCQTKRL